MGLEYSLTVFLPVCFGRSLFTNHNNIICREFIEKKTPFFENFSPIFRLSGGLSGYVLGTAMLAVGEDVHPSDRHVAHEIQQALGCTKCEEVLHLLVDHQDGSCTVLQVLFDHSRLNGKQVLQLLQKCTKEIMNIFFSSQPTCGYWQVHPHIYVRRKNMKNQVPRLGLSSMQEVLGSHIFHGPYPSSWRVRDIYKEIFDLFAGDFYMCIDLSHLFAGEPCMLRISYNWNRDLGWHHDVYTFWLDD